jgi:CDP-glucose 4,6-dehydratase
MGLDQSLDGRRVLVTGAYGLLGGWLVSALLESEATVTVIRRDDTSRSALVALGLEPRVTVVHGDITAESVLARAVAEYQIDTVFHLAAQTLVPTARRSPLSTFDTNVRGTWLTLEACRLNDCVQRVVVASSDKAYGSHTELPYTEAHALQPRFPYDASKAATDLIARSYWHTWRLPVAVTRFANLYGGGDFNLSRLVPETVVAALTGRAPVVRSDGSPERDFLYVEDAVAAYLAIAAALGDRQQPGPAAGEAFNAGGGRPQRVLDVVRLICQLAGSEIEPDVRGTGTPAGEIDRQWVDHSKLSVLTGWEPRVGLEDGLRRTLAWYREHLAAQ